MAQTSDRTSVGVPPEQHVYASQSDNPSTYQNGGMGTIGGVIAILFFWLCVKAACLGIIAVFIMFVLPGVPS